MESAKKKLPRAIQNLTAALEQYQKEKTELHFLAVSKAFENGVEAAWRELKRLVEDQGVEAPAPKMAVKQAAKLHFITEPEKWLDCIDARNNSIHDYFGISRNEYFELAQDFLSLVGTLK